MPVQSYSAHVQELEAFGMGYPLHGQERDRAVLGSWRRCIDQHRLDPSHTSDAHIVPAGQLRAHQEESEPLIHIARSGLERLYQQLKGLDYVLLLADQHGVAVDFLGHDRELVLEPGDLLAILSAGAYGMTMRSNYNTRPRVAEIMVDGNQTHLIRRRETVEELYAPESLLP